MNAKSLFSDIRVVIALTRLSAFASTANFFRGVQMVIFVQNLE